VPVERRGSARKIFYVVDGRKPGRKRRGRRRHDATTIKVKQRKKKVPPTLESQGRESGLSLRSAAKKKGKKKLQKFITKKVATVRFRGRNQERKFVKL